ncbi:MAG: response regulator transcription factor [Bacteroidia bacterium]
MIQIGIADDEILFRKGMKIMIESFGGMEIVVEADNGKQLIDRLAEASSLPEIILLDLNMPEMNGVDTTRLLQEKYPEIKVIILSSYFSKVFIRNMIELGASGYLSKNSLPGQVENTLHEVVEKGFSYNDKVLEVLRENLISRPNKLKMSFSTELSDREQEVLQLICEQYTTSEIGEKLFISSRTVDGHRNNLLQKLNCRNTAGLVVYAIQNQLVEIPPDVFWG